jgi:hypothetical protein
MSDPRDPIRIFIGVDARQPVGLAVLSHSIQWRSSRTVAIQPLILSQLPIKRRGLTDFTFSRFLVPWLCDFKGHAIFMDSDILVTGDIAELDACADTVNDVQVMQDQPRFEWPSVMLFNNALCRVLTPEYVDDKTNPLFDLNWARSVGTFPKEWNSCCFYNPPMPTAKLFHYTAGLPVWPETNGNRPEDVLWTKEHRQLNSSAPWRELMGPSIHAKLTMQLYKQRDFLYK